jgi:N-acetyl-1-D-myo-inositol-2-amino-2-deoxy-alpha-D-glucopyranoside deacetylase/mycothiol S-conjugate amidase
MSDNQHRTLVFVGAHPDDETFGLGGTLAHYALQGARTVYACATRGDVGSADPEHMEGFASSGDMRWAELACAAQELKLADVIYLGYRDSGMPGSPDNTHPEALAAAPPEEVTARVVKVLREVKPQVVVTFDPIGGYRHPDHIAIHHATVRAFHAAGDPARFPECGPAHQPQKLYYSVFPRRWLKLAVQVMPLLGRDPRRFGRNNDIDLTSLAGVDFPVHATIRPPRAASEMHRRAVACHKSQLAGGPPTNGLLSLIMRLSQPRDTFMRAHPPVPANARVRENDLFEGVK